MRKEAVFILLVCLLLVGSIGGCGPAKAPQANATNITASGGANEAANEAAKEAAAASNIKNVGTLSFKLNNVELRTYAGNDPSAQNYLFIWNLEVTNKGSSSEFVSGCGDLTFEGGERYGFVESSIMEDLTCKEFYLMPGTIKKMAVYFVFSDSNSYYRQAIAWEKVPGSKITYAAKQNSGDLSFAVDKSQIAYS